MKIIALIAAYCFFIGLKRAAREVEQRDMTAIGFAMCFAVGFIPIAMVGSGFGFTFWAVTTCAGVAMMLMTLALTTQQRWMDLGAMTSFVFSFAMMGIDLITLATGAAIGAFLFPIASNYTLKGDWLQRSRSNVVKVAILFGLVAVWWTANKHVNFNIYSIIRFFIN